MDTWTTNNAQGPPGFIPRHAIGVVNFARLTGETSLLPTAILTCCTLDADIVGGLQREDGSCEHLSMADLGLCFAAKGKLVQEALGNAMSILAPPCAPNCLNPPACSARLSKLMKRASEMSMIIAQLGPFHSVMRLLWSPGKTDLFLCPRCWALVTQRDTDWRAGLWKNLPGVLGLTSGPREPARKNRGDGEGYGEASQ